MLVRPNTNSFTVTDLFAGAGGSSQGAKAVRDVIVRIASNHNELALASHEANFPDTIHEIGDIRKLPIHEWEITTLLWASPECTNWTQAKGMKRVDDTQPMLFDDRTEAERRADEEAERSRALMEEVPAYLDSVIRRGGLVLGGVVENVIEARTKVNPAKWDQWVAAFGRMGYKSKLVALNSMHVWGTDTPRAPQSRDRMYFVYWHQSLGRDPDFDKWTRPRAWCETCQAWVLAVQVFKDHRRDMGRYRAQYVYRCPRTACRNAVVEPDALPASAAIDWHRPAKRIGDRAKPLAESTLRRIKAGIDRYWRPMLVPTGGTWRDEAAPVDQPMPTRLTRENDGVALPPFLTPMRSNERTRTLRISDQLATVVADGANHGLVASPGLLVPVEGRDGKAPASILGPARTQTTRNETGVALPPFMVELRGGGSDARSITDSAATVTASGNHLGMALPPLVMRNNNSTGSGAAMSTPAAEPMRTLTTAGHQSLLLPYYSTGTARPVAEPMGALSTRDRFGLASCCLGIDINQVRFRMLDPAEIARAMAFIPGYIVLGNKREQVHQLGNAVTPPAAEVLVKALYEAISGEELARE